MATGEIFDYLVKMKQKCTLQVIIQNDQCFLPILGIVACFIVNCSKFHLQFFSLAPGKNFLRSRSPRYSLATLTLGSKWNCRYCAFFQWKIHMCVWKAYESLGLLNEPKVVGTFYLFVSRVEATGAFISPISAELD